MATSETHIKSQYPLPAYNYRVTILPISVLGIHIATELAELIGAGTSISCSEVSGLNMEVETVTYKHGFSFLTGFDIIPGQHKEINLSIKKGITSKGSYLSDWINLSYPIIAPQPIGLMRKRDILIDLCDEKGKAVVRWTVIKAMPTKLEAPSFDANTNEVAFERMDLIAHRMKIEYVN